MHRRHPTAAAAAVGAVHSAANDNSKSDANLMDTARARRLQHCCADALRVLLPPTSSSNTSVSSVTKQFSSAASLQHSASAVTPRATAPQHVLLSSQSAAALKQGSRQHLADSSNSINSSSSSKWTAAHMDASDLAVVSLTALAWVLDSGAGECSSDSITAATDTFTTAPTVITTAAGAESSSTSTGSLLPEASSADLQQQQQPKLSRQPSKQLLLRPKSLAVLLEHTACTDSSSSSSSSSVAALYTAPSENAEPSLSSTLRRVSSKATKQQALAADYRPVRTADAVARELQQGIAPLEATVLHLLQALLLALEPGAGELLLYYAAILRFSAASLAILSPHLHCC
jgi:hypothetical protein